MEQERWLDRELAASRATWNLVVQTTLVAPAPRASDKGPEYWTDSWDGYTAARARLIKSITERRVSNPVLLGGDVHTAIHANLHARPEAPESPVVAAEIVSTSITSQGFATAQRSAALRAQNPHLRYHDAVQRGYHLLEVGRGALDAQVRAVATVKQPDAGISTAARVRVEAGKPGLVDA
jgi:alkaline phosphatase D